MLLCSLVNKLLQINLIVQNKSILERFNQNGLALQKRKKFELKSLYAPGAKWCWQE